MSRRLEDWLPILCEMAGKRDRRWSLAELAEAMNRSDSYVQRAFSGVVGESAKQFTRRLQLECAAVLLLTTERSVLDIALEAGFDSHEGFTRAFSKHFKKPPKDFRSDAKATGLADDVRHSQLILHVGPCVGLFRASTEPRTKERTMNYDITLQDSDAMTVMYKEARCSHAQIADTLGKLLPAVFGYAMGNNIQMVGPPMTLYMKWGPGMVTMRAGLAVAAGSEGNEEISVMTLDAGRTAVTIHTGPYEGLGDAHSAVEQFIDEEGLESDGPLREIYLTDPGEVPDPKDWKTQIMWPVNDAKE